MSLEPDEIKAVLEEAKGDGPRNKARKELVLAYELMESAIAQGLPPWDRRWLEFEAVDRILAAYGSGGAANSAAYDVGPAGDSPDLGNLNFDIPPGVIERIAGTARDTGGES